MLQSDASFIRDNLGIFCCPRCQGSLTLSGDTLGCSACQRGFAPVDDIPCLFWPNEWDPGKEDVTDRIKAFYEKNPFPDYDEYDSGGSLIAKARKGLFAKLLDDQIQFGARILECGCGTGQLSAFLSVASRTVVGADLCLNSLGLAHAFKRRNNLDNAHFLQMNLFRPCFKAGSFDLVISINTLHNLYSYDLEKALKEIQRVGRKHRYICVESYRNEEEKVNLLYWQLTLKVSTHRRSGRGGSNWPDTPATVRSSTLNRLDFQIGFGE